MSRSMAFADAVAASTCLKRVVVCELYDERGRLLATESNRCSPPDGICARLGQRDQQAAYPVESSCGWEHAEQRALAALYNDDAPHRAVIYGHDFPCPDCERSLRAAGVMLFDVQQAPDTGLRS